MSAPLQTGTRVVCINDKFLPAEIYWTPHLPVKGKVYTVRNVGDYAKGVGVTLVEIINQPIPVVRTDGTIFHMEPVFHQARFKPLDDSALDVFRSHLIDISEDA